VLRQWEGDQPYMYVYGSPGIGKSVLLQLAALRALFQGNPVLFHFRGDNSLMRLVDDNTVSTEELMKLKQLGAAGRPTLAETVFCYDSPLGFQANVGEVQNKKKVLIVQSPSANITNTRKSGARGFLLTPPPTEELVAVAELLGINEAQALQHVAKYGPFLRYLNNPKTANRSVIAGLAKLVPAGVDGLKAASSASREAHRLLVMSPHPEDSDDVVFSFASDYIRDKAVTRIAYSQASKLLDYANTIDVHGSLHGQVFENRMIDLLGQKDAKITFDAREVIPPTQAKATTAAAAATANADVGSANDVRFVDSMKVLHIAGAGVKLESLDAESALPAGESLRYRVLYAAPVSNTKSWDALLVEDESVAYLLQTTVAVKHPVKRDGLEAGAKLLKALGFKGEVKLVFLVPPVAFAEFKLPQKVEIKKGDESKTAGKWPQAKWCVTTVNAKRVWP